MANSIGGRIRLAIWISMAERQQRQRLRALQNNRQLARFVQEGRATGKQLGTGSYGSVEEVWIFCLTGNFRIVTFNLCTVF